MNRRMTAQRRGEDGGVAENRRNNTLNVGKVKKRGRRAIEAQRGSEKRRTKDRHLKGIKRKEETG